MNKMETIKLHDSPTTRDFVGIDTPFGFKFINGETLRQDENYKIKYSDDIRRETD